MSICVVVGGILLFLKNSLLQALMRWLPTTVSFNENEIQVVPGVEARSMKKQNVRQLTKSAGGAR